MHRMNLWIFMHVVHSYVRIQLNLGKSMKNLFPRLSVFVAITGLILAYSGTALGQDEAEYIETKKESSQVALGIFEDAAGLQNGGKF